MALIKEFRGEICWKMYKIIVLWLFTYFEVGGQVLLALMISLLSNYFLDELNAIWRKFEKNCDMICIAKIVYWCARFINI